MSEARFAEYVKRPDPNYAHQRVASGQWEASTAVEQARASFDELLPQGLATPDNHLFDIIDDWNETAVGAVWITVRERAGKPTAYIVDMFIEPEVRHKGHASRALQILEDKVREMGLAGIGLHVFGDNDVAHRLFQRRHYDPMSIFMFKWLQGGS
jgi:GNAT superfamily N-acetyltransferase